MTLISTIGTSLSNFPFLSDMIQVVPVVGVFVIIIVVLWRNKMEVEEHTRRTDRENLETLQDLSSLLSNLLSTVDRSKDEVIVRVKEEAQHTRAHVDSRVDLLEEKVKHYDKKS